VSKQQSTTLAEGFSALYELTAQRISDDVRSPATLEMQRGHGRWWAAELGADRRLVDIDEELLELVAAPRKPPRRSGAETLRKRLSTMRGVLALAHRRRWIRRLPAFPQVVAPWRPRQHYLRTYGDAVRIFERLQPHRAEWFWLCLWTGQHASDVERMTWADVDLNARSICLRNTKNRRVPIRVGTPAPLQRVLAAMFERGRPAAGANLVLPWPSRKHTLPLVCYRLGLPPVNAIDLRRTLATWMVAKLGITAAVCAWFGHSSPAMMARTYARHLPPQLAECTAHLDSFATTPNPGGATDQ
jgi:integrase